MKLKRLKINSYRNVRQCDLRFCNGVNILLGPNGAGKTTLLNFISKVLRSGLSDPSDPFSIEVEFEFPGGTMSGKIEQSESDSIAPRIFDSESAARTIRAVTSQNRRAPQVDLKLRFDASAELYSVRTTEKGVIIDEGATRKEPAEGWTLKLFETLEGTISHLFYFVILSALGPNHRQEPWEQHLRNTWRFDEGLDTFRAITAREDDNSLVNSELRPKVADVQFNSKVGRLVLAAEGIVAQDILGAVKRHSTNGAVDISFQQEDLKFLSETVRLLRLRSAEAKIELVESHAQGNPEANQRIFGNLRFWFTRQDGSIFRDDHLSYGQKRLLSFLYYLDANPSFVIADELVNGMHHVWIEECMNALGDRQAFLTSQNPLLLDYLTFESVEQVKDSIILCRTEIVDGKEEMVWRNLTADEADMFFSAYRVGIEHVGEILRTRGLW